MRIILIILNLLFFCMTLFAQTQVQQGCVKTRGRMVNGKHVHGVGLPGAVVSVKDRNDIAVKNKDGTFSFPTKGAQYMVQSVTKKDYALVDADAAPKTYQKSSNIQYFVMEVPEKLLQEKIDKERKIRRTLNNQLQEREDEIETLKAENKISQQRYQQLLQELYATQKSNLMLMSEIADRYAKLDYDQLDNFYRQVSNYIEEGELVKADSLLKTRGDLNSQIDEHLHQGALIQQKKEELNQAESVHQFDKEELACRCYSYFEKFSMQHLVDSAAKYIELRVQIDTTNVEWLNHAAQYLKNYKANYEASLAYNLKGLHHSKLQFGEISEWVGIFYNNIASLYSTCGNYSQALTLYEKALDIQRQILGSEHPVVANSYNNIGEVHSSMGNYAKALEFFQKTLVIQEEKLGTNHPKTSTTYNNIGCLLIRIGQYEKALEYLRKDLQIQENVHGQEHPNTVISYSNIGVAYEKMRNYSLALEYYHKALQIQKKILGDDHPNLSTILNNIGGVYAYQNKYLESLEYLNQALAIRIKAWGAEHPSVSTSYNNIGYIYSFQGDYSKAIEYYLKSATIREKTLGAEHPDMVDIYSNIGILYQKKGDYPQALEFIQKTIDIRENILGTEHVDIAKLYDIKGEIYSLQKKYVDALDWKQKALEIYEKKYGKEYKYTYQTKFDVMWLMSKDLERMKDYAFIATTDDGDTPARQQGMTGEYIMLELADWSINDTISLLDINLGLRGKPKSIVVMKEDSISQYHFENTIGIQYNLKFIGSKEKKRILKVYKKWKKEQK